MNAEQRSQPIASDWHAAVWAGIIAGLLFIMLEMFMVEVFTEGTLWQPLRMIGAIVLGEEVLPPPATFSMPIMVSALILHFVLSVVYACALAWLIKGHHTLTSVVLIGAVFGLAVYLINFYMFTDWFPWFMQARNWITVLSHILFGSAAGWVYMKLRVLKHG